MVAGAREGSAGDAVQGVVPRLVLEPATLGEAAEALGACARDRLAVAFVGGGTDLELGRPPTRLDAVVRTGRLARLVEHNPSDQIAVVEAGMTIADLQRQLGARGQRLALDPPLPQRATVGGILASNAWGPLRHRHGAGRDLVVGMTFVRADGIIAKGGGKVVKNVAGFDVPRLLVGSLGTLAMIGTVTFRLHPLPEAYATVVLPGLDAAAARALVAAIRASQLDPAAVAAILEEGHLRVAVRFEGFGPGVAEQRQRLLAVAERLGREAEPLGDEAARAFWARHDLIRSEGALRSKLTAPPAALVELVRAAAALARALSGGAAVLYPTLGAGFVSGAAADPAAGARAIEDTRAALRPLGGGVVVAAAPGELRALLDPWGPSPPGAAVMRRMKDQLDPEHRLAPGRFVGGI
jgi:glycolate oxidase FAD binding subunit